MTGPHCLTRCYSPIACGGFGYCRHRNEHGLPTEALAREWQLLDDPTVDDAVERKARQIVWAKFDGGPPQDERTLAELVKAHMAEAREALASDAA